MKHKLYIYFFVILLFFLKINVFALDNISGNITSDWKDGFCYNFTLNNTSGKEISDWKIYFKLEENTTLTSQWSGNFSHNGNNYTITPVERNKKISPNSKIDIGFCANGISRPFDITAIFDNLISQTPQTPVVSTPEQPSMPTNPTSYGNTDGEVVLKYPNDIWNSKSIDLNGDSKKDYILSLNPWNIASASGTATMSVDYVNKKIIYNQDLSDISIKNPGGYVLSYPEVYVGNKPWGGEYFETDSKLPVKFSDLKDLQLKINYKASFKDGLNGNVAMEGWFTKKKFQTTGVGPGESEMMVWLYSNGLNPAGNKIGETTVNLKINGVNRNEIFEIYKGDIGWEIISYRPKNGGWIEANIELNLKQLFDNFKLNTGNINYDNLYLQDWEFGTETGSPTTTKARYNWELSEYNVTGILNTPTITSTTPTTPANPNLSTTSQSDSYNVTGILNTPIVSNLSTTSQSDSYNVTGILNTPIVSNLSTTSQLNPTSSEKIQTSTIDIGTRKKINTLLNKFIIKNKENLSTKLVQVKTKLELLQQKYKNDTKKTSLLNFFMEIIDEIDKKISELK